MVGIWEVMASSSKNSVSPHRPRRSACGERSKAAELEHIRSLSIAERIKLALTVQSRFAWLEPKSRNP